MQHCIDRDPVAAVIGELQGGKSHDDAGTGGDDGFPHGSEREGERVAVEMVGALAMMDAVGGRALLALLLCGGQGLHSGPKATGTPRRQYWA